ncbi:MAG: hypothetical protein ACYTBX_12815, partial [Planctomycetota bacterium]
IVNFIPIRNLSGFRRILCSFVPQCLCGYESIMQNKANYKTEDRKIMAKDTPNVFDNCRESSTNRPFYAKQTQFSKKSSERKYLIKNGL